MKKFYLSVEQRQEIQNCLFIAAERLEAQLEALKKQGATVAMDASEALIQRRQHLAALFKVEEHEQ